MIIDDLNLFGCLLTPQETEAPLIVDPDAVLAAAVAGKRLQPVARWRPKVGKLGRCVEHVELAQRHCFDALKRRYGLALV